MPVNASGAIQQALTRFMPQIRTPPAKKGVSNWRILTPAERIAGSSLEVESFPATSIEDSRALIGDVINMVEGIDST